MDSIGQRNAVKDLSKPTTVGISIQTYEIDVLPMSVDRPLNKRYEILEELCLIHDDNLVRCDIDIFEILRMNARNTPAIMRRHDALAVPIVRNVRNHQHGDA
jgi:hypothetical protein